MNCFDRDVLTWINHFARTSPSFDASVVAIASSNAVKGALATVVLLWFWFGESKDQRRNREIIVATTAAACVAIVVGRLLALGLPYRPRPIDNPAISFVAPYGYPDGLLRGWSAFPSDHAMLFGAISAGLWFISRRLGVAAFVYTLVVILAPRVYLGMHHPSDILAGLALGVAMGLLANAAGTRRSISRLPLRWAEHHPRSFYAAAFIAAMQVATMFDGPRAVARELLTYLRERSAARAQQLVPEREAQVSQPPRFPGAAALEPAAPLKMPLPLRIGETALR